MTRRPVLAALATALVATATLAAPPVENKTEGDSQVLRELLAAHNRERAEAKLPPLALDPKLAAAAQAHSEDMAAHKKMTHDGSDGSTPTDRIKRQKYPFRNDGENVAEGYRTVDKVMKGWMESPHHRDNILGKFTQVGFGLARDDEGYPYWTADFGTPYEKLDSTQAADDLVKAINKARSAEGLPPLRANSKLSEAAAKIAGAYAKADSFQIANTGDDLVTTVKGLGYGFREIAQLAASGQSSGSEALKTWMDTKGNREHILSKSLRDVGVGYASSKSDKPYWCLVLASPLSR